MNIGILGYGKEGKSAEKYFTNEHHQVEIFDNFTTEDLARTDLSQFDLILRSPSVHPQPDFSSMTKYFFEHCPCPIIGVTGTKGKGTTCSIITNLLKNLGENVYLVGNIGAPSLDILDQLTPTDVVVYELSSFQLWDLGKSPHVAVILPIEPDHLNVHDNYHDYVNAKSNITKHQSPNDYLIFYRHNTDVNQIAEQSAAHRIGYPLSNHPKLRELTSHLAIPGRHNQDNAEAALLAVASLLNQPIKQFITNHHDCIIKTFQNFKGLPHRLEFIRELNGVKYYDDNFSTTPTSLAVALQSFPKSKIILIAGGRDKTNNADLPEIADLIKNSPVVKAILIGESGHELIKLLNHAELADSLESAVQLAKTSAEDLSADIVLMSPSAASFDMFDNVYDRGAQFQKLIHNL